MNMVRTVIGIDPGLASTGIGIISGTPQCIEKYGFGCIKTSPQFTHQSRIYKIYSELSEIFDKEKPSMVVIEDAFSVPEFPKSGIILGKVIGAVMVACSTSGVNSMDVQVRLAKQILTGNGKASKEQLEKAVRNYLGHKIKISPFHASDALALAIIGIMRL